MQIAMERVASARGLNCEVVVEGEDDPPRVMMDAVISSALFVTVDVDDDDVLLSFDCDVAAWTTTFCAPFDLDLRVAADEDDAPPPRAIAATNIAGLSFKLIISPL